MKPKLALPVLVAVGAWLLTGCGGAPAGGSATVGGEQVPTSGTPAPSASSGDRSGRGKAQVVMQNIEFSPASITVKKGETVRWTNRDSVAHTVTADSGARFDSANLNARGVYEYTTTHAGTIHYYCRIHGKQMSGTITVTG